MIYVIEFAILHLLFYTVYKVLLSGETQLSFLRRFLIGSTLLSLLVPAIHIPNSSLPTVNTEAIVLPAMSIVKTDASQNTINWPLLIIVAIGILILIRMIRSLIQLRRFYRSSSSREIDSIPVREVIGLQNSFTFFRWIFIDPEFFDNPKDIARHEYGHAKLLHSADLIFFYLLSVPFWWVPSIWMMIKELRKVHEFEADQYALSISNETYVKTLVHSTLKAHGMNLASSFDDAPIVNRINFIKKMKKKMNPLKAISITTILAISAAMFACEDKLESEIKQIAADSNQQMEYSDKVVEALAELKKNNPDKEYAVVETPIDNEGKIVKLQEYDPNQIKHVFVTEKDGEKALTMILDKSSDLFAKTIELQTVEMGDNDIYTITDEVASFPGGLVAFYEYMSSELKYPEQAQKMGVEGRVFVQFIVEPDGSLSNLEVMKGIGAGCDAEALRVMESSPNWEPGKVNGKPVRQKLIQNIAFKL